MSLPDFPLALCCISQKSTTEDEETETEDDEHESSNTNDTATPKPDPVDAVKLAAQRRERELAEEQQRERRRVAKQRKKERMMERKKRQKAAQIKAKSKKRSKTKCQSGSPESDPNALKKGSSRKKKRNDDFDAILAEHKKEIEDEMKANETVSALLGDELCSNWDLLTRDAVYFDPNFELKKKFKTLISVFC